MWSEYIYKKKKHQVCHIFASDVRVTRVPVVVKILSQFITHQVVTTIVDPRNGFTLSRIELLPRAAATAAHRLSH